MRFQVFKRITNYIENSLENITLQTLTEENSLTSFIIQISKVFINLVE